MCALALSLVVLFSVAAAASAQNRAAVEGSPEAYRAITRHRMAGAKAEAQSRADKAKAQDAEERKLRTWHNLDANQNYQGRLEAVVVIAKVRRPSGEIVEIPLENLPEEEQQIVRRKIAAGKRTINE